MDYEQSIALYQQGKTAWNEWANGMLAEKKRLHETGKWEAEKESWKDEAKADFYKHTFDVKANFEGFIFPGFILFESTQFIDKSTFRDTIFSDMARFQRAVFSNETLFDDATFFGHAFFHEASFYARIEFSGASFKRSTSFLKAKFIADPDKTTTVANIADFRAIKSEAYFNLDGARFEQVPDFTQAHFLEAPSLDRIVIGPKARENPTPPATNPPSPHGEPVEPREGGKRQAAILRQAQDEGKRQAQDEGKQQAGDEAATKAANKERAEKQQIPARWRHLRRLATQGHDHQNEGDFFAEELKSRRNVFDFPKGKNWQRWWAGWLYQLFSDFGRSIARPFCWWLGGIALYFLALLTTHDFIVKSRPPFELGLNGCLLGDSTPWSTALKVAFDNALFLPQFGVSNAQGQENLCLFGYDTGLKIPNLPPVPLVPDWIAGLGFAHALFSLIMVFLILLAIRNQFRIR